MNKFLASFLSFKRILATAYFAGCFIFFAFFFQYHLYYFEQMQLFRLSGDYIAGYFHKPASLSCLTGDFLTQFYFLKAGGAIVITGCLLLLWHLIDWAISRLTPWKYSYLLALLATALITSFHFDIAYPLAATISLIIALAVFRFYAALKSSTNRIVAGVALAPLLYMAAGFAVYLFLLFVLLYELKIKQTKSWMRLTYSFTLVLIVLIIPTSLRTLYYLTPKQAYKYPFTKPINPTPNFAFESVFSLDCEWYFNHPKKTIELARKTTNKNRYVNYYYNLASAAIDKLPENLLSFDQMGIEEMSIPFEKQSNSLNLLFGNEVFYFIGDVNASQHYVLVSNTFSPKCEGSRMVRRMVETNIINGEYAAAGKYIKMLNQTLFHRGWANEMEQFLYDEELCNKTPWIADKRAQMPLKDHIMCDHNFINSLYYLLDDHPDNQAALNYLLCICLLKKNINAFYRALTTYKYKGTNLPRLYQEALLVYYDVHKNDKDLKLLQLSDEVVKQLMLYKKKYSQYKGNKKALSREFGGTYWFYMNFATN